MLIILFLFALIRTLHGAPLSSSADAANGFSTLDLRDTQSHLGERAISDIILSCFATIFACTWTAVHPNIPAPTDCWWTRFKRQLVTMLYGLLIPEAITAWALKQRMSAKKIVDDYNNAVVKNEQTRKSISFLDGIFKDSPLPAALKDGEVPPWTMVHGFFLQMGGFMLSKGGRPIQTIFSENSRFSKENMVFMEQIIAAGMIDRPFITAEDIEDRSKGDAISKTLITFQTTWFIAQCIARWSSHLPVTELEVVTLGFAMLNGITYFLWWHKPQNVGRPVFLEIKSVEPPLANAPEGHIGLCLMDLCSRVAKNEDPEEVLASSKKSYLWRKFPQGSFGLKKFIYRMPLHILRALTCPLGKLGDIEGLNIDMKPGDRRVPMFYSGNADVIEPGFNMANYVASAIALIFGLVHLIPGWYFHFASVEEKWLWRVSAIIITAAPAYVEPRVRPDFRSSLPELKYMRVISICFYIISRIILLTLSFASLRSLPPAALQTIKWTTFIPHI